MKYLQTFDQKYHGTTLPDNWEDIKRQLDEKNHRIDYEELTYLFSDLIDDEVIEIEDVKKFYRYDKTVKGDATYGTIKYDVRIKILDKSRLDEYMDYKWSVNFYGLLQDYYKFRILNGATKSYFKTHPERDIDEFNLWGRAVFI